MASGKYLAWMIFCGTPKIMLEVLGGLNEHVIYRYINVDFDFFVIFRL